MVYTQIWAVVASVFSFAAIYMFSSCCVFFLPYVDTKVPIPGQNVSQKVVLWQNF